MNPQIKDDFSFLKVMINDSKRQSSSLYRPGPYWNYKVKSAISEIKRCGIKDFRGSSNLIGLSYADNLVIDIRDAYNYGFRKIIIWGTKLFPFSKIYDAQLAQTRNYAAESIRNCQENLNSKPRVRELLGKYRLPYSLLGGCKKAVNINGQDYAIHYLNVLEQHDNVAAHIRYDMARTVFEIGGGFGVNVHLLIENYPNIRKVIYLDIPPNLYVGTQYLKAFYGEAVSDCRKFQNLETIKFTDTDDLEIFCIAPWQIEKLQAQVDIFINAHSFVEMPKDIVSNYAHHIMRLNSSDKSAIALISYDLFDLTTTFDPANLPQFFPGRKFQFFEHEGLVDSSRRNLYYVSSGNIPVEES
ncbi:putative sugar O-methyltransferase [Methanolobus sp.]|jgi:putative sugar O-methyltransferase|uniref:putative sugar O-methyltransferase n=1 Tax=Methanolobus sp. TaxID=1874737 RepID=UPI0025F59703|nr:putative sugar O-methyltransferase [Methanolobus sp.]